MSSYIGLFIGTCLVIAWGDCRSPPVLLCHGKLDSAATFVPLVRRLPTDMYYVALDLPGNGKSDWMPPGLPLSVFDLMYPVHLLVRHFRWKQFTFVGHSLGALVGLHYDAANPGRVRRIVLLDPVPAYVSWEPHELPQWYDKYIGSYFTRETYHKANSPRQTAPKYTRREVLDLLQSSRGITLEAAEVIADRVVEPAGHQLYRFTFDQRMKKVTKPPRSAELLERIYTSITIPILMVLARDSVSLGSYDKVPFVHEPQKYPRSNYSVCTVDGNHDVHLSHPERVAPLVAMFLSPVASKL